MKLGHLRKSDKNKFLKPKRKILQNIFGPIKQHNECGDKKKKKKNRELEIIYNKKVLETNKKGKLCCM